MAAKKAVKVSKERLEELEDLKAIMNTVQGSRFILRLLRITGPYQSRFHADARVHAFMDGERNFGCRIVADLLEACPEQYVRLIADAKINQAAKEAVNEIHKVEQDDEAGTD